MRSPIAFVLLLPSLALAQEPTTPAPAKVVDGAFGIGFTNQYFFRGILQENQGFIAQPWVELGWTLYEGGESLQKVGLTFGLWNSLHDGPTGGAGGIWYESDFTIGLHGKVADRWQVGAEYTAYHSPNGSFGTVEELAFSVGFDDREHLVQSLDTGLRPSLLLAIETDGQRDAGNHVGIYAEVAVKPAWGIGKLGEMDLTLTVPVTVGFSLSDYYEDVNGGDDDFFGYFDVGGVVSADLDFLPARAGKWTGELGLHWLLLGDNNEQRNVGDTTELILSLAVSTTF